MSQLLDNAAKFTPRGGIVGVMVRAREEAYELIVADTGTGVPKERVERIFDPLSRRRRELVQPGWGCLEVGAGRGSMAVWLAEQVGESGEVVATDIDVTDAT
jgi:signal transduction histidine kinase